MSSDEKKKGSRKASKVVGGGPSVSIPGEEREMPEYVPPTFQNLAGDEAISKRAYKRVELYFDYCKSRRSEWEKRWESYYKAVFGLSDRRAYKGKANIHVPEIYRCVQNIKPRIMESLFGVSPYFKVMGKDEANSKKTEMGQSVLSSYLDIMKFQERFTSLIDGACIYGTNFAKIYWRREYAEMIEIEDEVETPSIDEMGNPIPSLKVRKPIVKSRPVYDAPWLEVPDISDIFIDPMANDIQSSDGIIHRMLRDYRYLKDRERAGIYMNVDKCKTSDDGHGDSERQNRTEHLSDSSDMPEKDASPDKYLLLEYWGKFDIEGKGEEEECIIVVDKKSKTVLMVAKNWMWKKQRPFISARIDPSQAEFYSWGIVGPMMKVQMFLNAVANNTLDLAAMKLSPALLVGAGIDIPINQLQFTPGQVIRAAGPLSEIKVLTCDGDVGSGQRLMTNLQEIMREGTGAIQAISGLADPNNTTAYGYGQMIEQGTARLGMIARRIESEALEPALRMVMQLVGQYETRKKILRTVGEKGAEYVELDPVGFGQDLDVVVFGTSRRREQISVSKTISDYTQTWGPILPDNIKIRLAKKSYELLGLKEVDDVFPNSFPGMETSIQEEHDLIMGGRFTPPMWEDDHVAHLQAHEVLTKNPMFADKARKNPKILQILRQHIQTHMQYLQAQEQQQQQQQMQQMQQGQQGQPQGQPVQQAQGQPQQGAS